MEEEFSSPRRRVENGSFNFCENIANKEAITPPAFRSIYVAARMWVRALQTRKRGNVRRRQNRL